LLKFVLKLTARLSPTWIGWFFTHMSFILPFDRLLESENLLVFHHPKPSYTLHILFIPKKTISNLANLQPEDNSFLSELFASIQEIIVKYDLEQYGYRLIVNGGQYQEIPQLHFHLISEDYPDFTSIPIESTIMVESKES